MLHWRALEKSMPNLYGLKLKITSVSAKILVFGGQTRSQCLARLKITRISARIIVLGGQTCRPTWERLKRTFISARILVFGGKHGAWCGLRQKRTSPVNFLSFIFFCESLWNLIKGPFYNQSCKCISWTQTSTTSSKRIFCIYFGYT